jgi:purine-nucleoside phosphorylase
LETIEYLRECLHRTPKLALVLGSGLGSIADDFADPRRIPFEDIPGFPRTTVAGHPGAIVSGTWQGVDVVALQGRFHLYEGWSPEFVALPLRALREIGAEILIVTNAAGATRVRFQPGDLMLIVDHINFMFRNPLIGPVAPGEERFPDMSDPYDRDLRQLALKVAAEQGIALELGVYAGVLGPSYETPAEVRMLTSLGADALGMSTVPEVVAARALGMRVLGISCITNAAAGLGPRAPDHSEVLEVGAQASERMARLLRALTPRIPYAAGAQEKTG